MGWSALPQKFLVIACQDPNDSKSSWLHVDIIFQLCFHSFEVYSSIDSSKMIGNFLEASSFNRLFLKLHRACTASHLSSLHFTSLKSQAALYTWRERKKQHWIPERIRLCCHWHRNGVRATSHTSQRLWPCYCEGSWSASKGHTTDIVC